MSVNFKKEIWDKNKYMQIGFLSFLLFVWYAAYLLLNDVDLTKSGTFGDSFGFVNSFFSVCAFVAVLLSLKNQQSQIDKQQKEYFESKQDTEKRVEEERFFRLLDLYRENLNGLKDGKCQNGLDVVINMLDKTHELYEKRRYPIKPKVEAAVQYEAHALFTSFSEYTKVHQRYFSVVRLIVEVIESNKNDNYIYYCKLFSTSLTWYEKEYILACYLLSERKKLPEVCAIFNEGLSGFSGIEKRWRGTLQFYFNANKVRSPGAGFEKRVEFIKTILKSEEKSSISEMMAFLYEVEQSSECPDRMLKFVYKITKLQISALNGGDDLEFQRLSRVMQFVRLNLPKIAQAKQNKNRKKKWKHKGVATINDA